ncbi:MAG TPA: hypothetical protein VF017_03900 [Thermoanaerobaculia bacterium]|nr:hypothetical protein [Thermoanaerobaculia bacterium]
MATRRRGALAACWLALAACQASPVGREDQDQPPASPAGLVALTPPPALVEAASRLGLPAPQNASLGELAFPVDDQGPIAASFYFLSSSFFEVDEVRIFLEALIRHDPGRQVFLFTDESLETGLSAAALPAVTVVRTAPLPYSPWPRDPFASTRDGRGNVVLVARSRLQPGREDDLWMAAEVAKALPASLAGPAGRARWALSPVYFHTGQMLPERSSLRLSVHSVEPLALELAGIPAVPAERFGTPEGIAPYFRAARRAIEQVAGLWGRPAELVHPMPGGGPEDVPLVARLAGGAGFDLDSLLTFLPGAAGREVAAVADVSLGRDLLAATTAAEWGAFAATYRLQPDRTAARQRLAAHLESPRARGLGAFLDTVASHLGAKGHRVERIPVLLVPIEILADAENLPAGDFLVGWNNVVLSRRGAALVAEGFASGLPAADEALRRRFQEAGAELVLLPILRQSVVRGGGYRCASSHLPRGMGR